MTQVSGSIIATTQGQEISDSVVELFQLTNPRTDQPILYFHAGQEENPEGQFVDITFRDSEAPYTERTYNALPMSLEGQKLEADGATNRPTLTVANVLTTFSDALANFSYGDLVGYKLIKRTTLQSHLNSGTTGAQGTAPIEFPQVSYLIDRVASETNMAVTFELAVPFDLENIKVPARVVLGKYCNWVYKGHSLGHGGGCTWKSLRNVGASGTQYVFLNERDEYVIPASTTQFANAASYDPTADYTSPTIVIYNGKYWQATEDSTGELPLDDTGYWDIVHGYTTWSSSAGSYAKGAFVFNDGNLWKCILAHTAAASKEPEANSAYWTVGDVCGKTLKSCSRRFGVKANNVPFREWVNRGLPFGGFPGSDKYR